MIIIVISYDEQFSCSFAASNNAPIDSKQELLNFTCQKMGLNPSVVSEILMVEGDGVTQECYGVYDKNDLISFFHNVREK